MKWQPIETAPKDGTEIDLLCERTHCYGAVDVVRKVDCSWGDIANQYTGETYQGWRGISETYAKNAPTHWMPLPDPPENLTPPA